MPLHSLAQEKSVFLAVLGNRPALGEPRADLGAAAFKLNDAAIDLTVRVKRCSRGIDGGIKVLGTAFRATLILTVGTRIAKTPLCCFGFASWCWQDAVKLLITIATKYEWWCGCESYALISFSASWQAT